LTNWLWFIPFPGVTPSAMLWHSLSLSGIDEGVGSGDGSRLDCRA
jgi:hypothetical protein